LLQFIGHLTPSHTSGWTRAVTFDVSPSIQAAFGSSDVEPVASVLGVTWAAVLSPHVVAGSILQGPRDLLTVPRADPAASLVLLVVPQRNAVFVIVPLSASIWTQGAVNAHKLVGSSLKRNVSIE
jgi:hypothetical protein